MTEKLYKAIVYDTTSGELADQDCLPIEEDFNRFECKGHLDSGDCTVIIFEPSEGLFLAIRDKEIVEVRGNDILKSPRGGN